MKFNLPIRRLRLAFIFALFGLLSSAHAASIAWNAPQASSGAGDLSLTGGTIHYALNGGSASTTVSGVNFGASNYADFPSGVSFTPTGASAGSTPQVGTLDDVYGGGAMVSTGNTHYDTLLASQAYSNGTPSGITTGTMQFSGLTAGKDYRVQLWYNDQRTSLDTRVMTFGDGLGNTVDLAGGNTAAGVQGNAYGQYAVGQFTASGATQSLTMATNGFGNVHYNAVLLQSLTPTPPPGPLDPKASSGWTIDTQDEWTRAAGQAAQFNITSGEANPTVNGAVFETRVQRYTQKQKFTKLTLKQTAAWGSGKWDNSGNIGPSIGEQDAPIFISPADGDYWYLNATSGGGQYNAWHSTDMQNWTAHGNVTGKDWVTTAEYADGKFYVYYDEPNDEDPRLMVFSDLANGIKTEHGMVFNDPSHGSDVGVFRDLDGTFHMVYEDWSAINASQHSWDSQYTGHTSSPDGINGFTAHEHTAIIDQRGNPTGVIQSYTHPHNGTYTYEVHDGSLDAYGDFEMIRVGDRYYLFSDYHPDGEAIGLCYWTSEDINSAFEFGGVIRTNTHPDATAGFVEGEFVLIIQGNGGEDLTSSGPWVDSIQCQVGVDTDDDGVADVWTDWQDVSETYGRIDGFAKVFSLDPAELDLSGLPEGYGIQIRFNTSDLGAVMDSLQLDSTTVPEPATMSLLALGGVAMLRRRKK